MMLKDEVVDLTIIGGGPTGLTTALLAERLGLSVRILDKAGGPLEVGRADALNARTQETLEVTGILAALEPKGLKCNTSSTFSDGEFISRQSHWWTSLRNVHRQNFLMIGQADVEAALQAQLDQRVEYDTAVTKVEECSEAGKTFVRTHLQDQVIVSRYAVGADGARSFVRDQLGVSFLGSKPEMVWAVLDTFLDTDFPICPEIITFQHEGQARISWIPRERGMARFYVLLDGEITQPLAEAEIRKFLKPYRVDFVRTEWFSTFDVKERVVSTMFSPKRSIVLAGDAAHIHSVNGGQGLNTGIADAFALAWRLHLAVRGHPNALQSFENERLETARNVIDVAAKLVRSTVRTAKEYVGLIEQSAKYITGIGVEYPPRAPMIQGIAAGLFAPGRRCPDVYLHAGPDGTAKRIYTLARYGTFILLVLPAAAAVSPALPELPSAWREFVEVWTVGADELAAESAAEPAAAETNGDTNGLANGHANCHANSLANGHARDESEGQAPTTPNGAPNPPPPSEPTRRFSCMTQDGLAESVDVGDGGGTVVVVRPDMYVGYVGEDPLGYLEGVFGEDGLVGRVASGDEGNALKAPGLTECPIAL